MINTDKYERMTKKELLLEIEQLNNELEALWGITNDWSICEDDYSMHDQYENLDERYTYNDEGRLILKELYIHTEEDGWQPKVNA